MSGLAVAIEYIFEAKQCDLCGLTVGFIPCEHPKNAYCEKFRQQAAIDAKTVNMHAPKNKQIK